MKKNTLLALVSLFLAGSARSDEGMWLFNQPPRQAFQDRYKFDATPAWLDHLQRSSVRFNSGGSGSFVSEDGLLISNHHVGADALQKLSSEKSNYLRDGFYAKTLAEEVKCLDLELNVLQSIEDVTARVNAAIPKDAPTSAAMLARRKVIAEIEKESLDKTGLRSDVVTLWQGGAYHLYCYKKYTDVRLVFAPEQQAAFYGGDPDNFEFPRFDLDICLFRAYENDQPAKVKDFLKFSPTGPEAGDLVFVSGHPGRTSRLLTVGELKYTRDVTTPFRLASLKRQEVLLVNWSQRAEENARRAREDLFGIQNSRKAIDGRLAGLLDPDLMNQKIKEETDFKAKLADKPEYASTLAAYQKIEDSTKVSGSQAYRYSMLEGGLGFNCDSFKLARTLLRSAEEQAKPNGERLREYSESGKASMELALLSEKPIYPDLEVLLLTDSLTALVSQLGAEDPLVQKILAGKSPVERATYLIKFTEVRDLSFRKQVYNGGAKYVAAAKDPMIELARIVDGEARAMRKIEEEQSEIRQQGHAAIARAHNALLGTAGYPDATFTLRLSYGTVKGYNEGDNQIDPFTTLGGLYEKAKAMKNKEPFDLPARWQKRKSSLNLKTPYNFVSTDDIIGGNSGSPVVNRDGEFVGIIFDGNIQSLAWDFAFGEKQGRATSVDSAAIIESLNKVYVVKDLSRELLTGHRGK